MDPTNVQSARPRHRQTKRAAATPVLALVFWFLLATPAGAHTGFESSRPSEGAVVETSVDTVTITFTNEATETGEGFVLLDSQLGLRSPTSVSNPVVGVFVLSFDPEVSAGEVGVRWTVKAPDAHPINGAFQFSVAPPATSADQPAREPDPALVEEAAQQSLDEFLAEGGPTQSGRTIAHVGRFLAMGGMMVALGFLVFALTVMRGTRRELRVLLFWIRRAGLVIVLGTVLDAVGQVIFETGAGVGAALDPGAYLDVLSSSLGLALLLRFVGGAVVAGGARVSMVHAHTARDPIASVSARVPIGAGSTRVADHPPDYWDDHNVAWDLDRHGIVAALGFLALLVSHTFDGHTVTEGSRLLTGMASGLHVLAAAIWVGGVGALALVMRERARRDEPSHALMMVVRYSVVATIALVAVVVLGVYLAVVILDSPSELVTTAWGRLFLAKSAVVALAAAMGAHNHHVIVPALEESEEARPAVARLRRTLRNEVVALSVVVVLTALLVRAASTL